MAQNTYEQEAYFFIMSEMNICIPRQKETGSSDIVRKL